MATSNNGALAAAARSALRAPSILNTQPWRWVIGDECLELHADRQRQLTTADPSGIMLLASCGSGLHHARLSIAAAGWTASVVRLPDPSRPDLLAQIRLGEPMVASPHEQALYRAIQQRRTDRRPFSDEPVPDADIASLVAAAQAEGLGLHRLLLSQMPMFAIAVARAGAAETGSAAYREELVRWTNRPVWSGDGVPAGTTVRHVPRRVPVRELAVAPHEGSWIEAGGDRGAAFLVLFGEGDEPVDWVRAGEGLSAVLLTAVTLGLSTAPISDVIEVAQTRELVRGLLPGRGHPYLAVRCGYGPSTDDLPAAPRRDARETIDGLIDGAGSAASARNSH